MGYQLHTYWTEDDTFVILTRQDFEYLMSIASQDLEIAEAVDIYINDSHPMAKLAEASKQIFKNKDGKDANN